MGEKITTWRTVCLCGEYVLYYPQKLVLETNKQPEVDMSARIVHLTCCGGCKKTIGYDFPSEFIKISQDVLALENMEEFVKKTNDKMKRLYGVYGWVAKSGHDLEDFIGEKLDDVEQIITRIDRDSQGNDYFDKTK